MKEWTEKQYLLIMIQPFQTIAIVPNINGQESSQFMCYPAKAGDISGLLIAIHTALDRMHKGHLSPFHSQHGTREQIILRFHCSRASRVQILRLKK